MENRRRNFLIVLGGVAVLVAGIAFLYSPDFRSEDASGAIGAVQKHRTKQIAQSDVILGDEKARHKATILYRDYLNDASRLQSAAAGLGNMVLAREANKANLQGVAANLEAHSAELQNRYMEAMKETLNSMNELLNREGAALGAKLPNMTAELQSLAADLNSKLDTANMEALNNRLENVAGQLQAISATDLGNAEAHLASALKDLNNKTELNDQEALAAAQQLGVVAADLQSEMQFSHFMENRVEYLNNIELQSKTLDNMEASLGSLLGSKLDNSSELMNKLENMAEALGDQAATLESEALQNMQENLANQTELASMIDNMEASLGSLEYSKDKLSSRTLENLNQQLGSVQQALANFETQLQSSAAFSMQFELASISEHLQNAVELQSRGGSFDQNRSTLENVAALESKSANNLGSMIANAAELASKLDSSSQLGSMIWNRDSLGSFQAYLGNMSQNLQSRTLDSKDAGALQSQALALESKTQ